MPRPKWRWAVLFLTLVVSCAVASDLPRAAPEELGFASQRLARIDEFYGDKVAKKELAGIVILIARHGKIAHHSAIGYSDLVRRRRMERDTIFRLYSMTKPIAAAALMMLYEEGRFQLDDPLAKHLPEFTGLRVLRTPEAKLTDTVPAVREPTIQDLFRHTAGFAHGGEPATNAVDAAYIKEDLFGLDTPLAVMTEKLAKIPLKHQPGTTFEYSIAPDVQARLVEVISGMSFERFLQTRLFGPLAMEDTGYRAKEPSRLAPVHWSKDGKLVTCDDEHGCPKPMTFLLESSSINSYTKDHAHKGGSYGLVGTAKDYWRFAQMLANGGELDGRRFLGPRTVGYMARDHLETISNGTLSEGIGWGLGFAVLKDPVAAGLIGSEGSFYWAGGAETIFWVDPKENLVVIAMTQHMLVPTVGQAQLRSQLSAMIYGALVH